MRANKISVNIIIICHYFSYVFCLPYKIAERKQVGIESGACYNKKRKDVFNIMAGFNKKNEPDWSMFL